MLDAIDLELRWKLLIAALAEAAMTIVRTSFSKIVTEGGDFGCLLYDRSGRMVAQDAGVSSKLGVAPRVVQAILDKYSITQIRPNDVFITNDPWLCAGHLYDVALVKPIFYDGRLTGFAEALAHLPDIGGSLSNDTRDVYEEGLFLPAVKFMSEGEPVQELWDVIRGNVRIPDQIEGDITALMAALDIIESRVVGHLQEYGDDFDDISNQIIAVSSAALKRSLIELVPDGVYSGVAEIDGFEDEQPLLIKVTITARASRLELDFDGTSAQSAKAINCTEAYSTAWVLYAVRCLFGTSIPYNQGLIDPISIRIPRPSLLNAERPAPVRMKSNAGNFIPYAIFNAVADVLPSKVMAESGGKCTVRCFARSKGGHIAETFQFMGGFGARASKNGIACMAFPASGAETPIELIEKSLPITIVSKELLRGSGGAGRFVGGAGQRIGIRGDSESGVRVLVQNMRTRKAPAGYGGGADGSPRATRVNGESVPGKTSINLMKGDLLELQVAAGGGYGTTNHAPRSRDENG